jgi:hypothetical protein
VKHLYIGRAAIMVAVGVAILSSGAAAASAQTATTTVSGSATRAIPQIPFSSFGCSGYVCVGINGSGTQVSFLYSVVQDPSSVPVYSTGFLYLENSSGTVIATHSLGRHKLAGFPKKEQYNWNGPNWTFRDQDKVCAGWSGIPGFPCELILG